MAYASISTYPGIRLVASLPQELNFVMENGRPVPLRGRHDGNFPVTGGAVEVLRAQSTYWSDPFFHFPIPARHDRQPTGHPAGPLSSIAQVPLLHRSARSKIALEGTLALQLPGRLAVVLKCLATLHALVKKHQRLLNILAGGSTCL